MFEDFLLEELWEAYFTARKGKRHTIDEHRFELNAMENILDLREAILRRVYKPSRGVAFIIQDPVTREIVAAPFRDRVVHHFLYNICAEWWDRRFSADSYSCRKQKGTLYAQERLQKHIRQALNESPSHRGFIVKLDLRGYFMSLDHEKLYERIVWGLERQFYDYGCNRAVGSAENGSGCVDDGFAENVYGCVDLEKRWERDRFNGIRCRPEDKAELFETVKYLWREGIFDEPMKNIAIRGKRSDWRYLAPSKSLFQQPKGRGIVIGNLTSQLLSNIFMDQFDRFVRFELGYKHYGRYVDDFFVLVPWERKAQVLRDIVVMEKYLRREMGLTLHPNKRYTQEVDKGVPFVGAVVYEKCKVPGRRARRNCFAAAYRLATNGEGDIEGMISRLGCMEHLDSYKFVEKVWRSFGWG